MPTLTTRHNLQGVRRHQGLVQLIGVAALIAVAVSGCFLLADQRDCTASSQCHVRFGYASVCNANFCESSEEFVKKHTIVVDSATDPDKLGCEIDKPFADSADDPSTIAIGYILAAGRPAEEKRLAAAREAIRLANIEARAKDPVFGLVVCRHSVANVNDETEARGGDTPAAQAETLLNRFQVPVIIGPARSRDAEYILGMLEERESDTLLISPSASSKVLDKFVNKDTPLLWRTVPSGDIQAKALSEAIARSGQKHLLTLSYYGEGGIDRYSEPFLMYLENTGEFEVSRTTYGPTNVETKTNELKEKCAELQGCGALFISSLTGDQDDVFNTIPGNAGPLFVTDSSSNNATLAALAKSETASSWAQSCVLGARYHYDHSRGSVGDSVVTDLRQAFDSGSVAANCDNTCQANDPHIARTFDAVWLAINGAHWSQLKYGEVRGTWVRDGLRAMTASAAADSTELPINGLLYRDANRLGVVLNVVGASGPLDYKADELVVGDASQTQSGAPDDELIDKYVELWRIRLQGDEPTFKSCRDSETYCTTEFVADCAEAISPAATPENR